MWHARHVARSVQARHRGPGEFINENARRAVTRTEADFGNVHFDHIFAVIGAPPLMEPAARRALDLVQDLFDLADRVGMKVG
ncbi:hypothetical protein AJ88_38215 [Mesorhizobium amorphae CCBAU 01583]|nr:hypothetical protein AJ88_38215 [Mesorhizobium amorphae CCBAU 01583]